MHQYEVAFHPVRCNKFPDLKIFVHLAKLKAVGSTFEENKKVLQKQDFNDLVETGGIILLFWVLLQQQELQFQRVPQQPLLLSSPLF